MFLDRDGQTKYRLGPVEITGDAINRRDRHLRHGGGAAVGQGWQIQFDMTDEGADTFADVTTRLEGRQLAIVVDQEVISAPTVQNAITGGVGVITGSFTEARAKDLATQLNAGPPGGAHDRAGADREPDARRRVAPAGARRGRGGPHPALPVPLLPGARDRGLGRDGDLGFLAIAVALAGQIDRLQPDARRRRRPRDLAGCDRRLVHRVLRAAEGRGPRRQVACSAVGRASSGSFKTIVAADFVTAIAALVLYHGDLSVEGSR